MKEEERLSFFPGNSSANKKPGTLFAVVLPTAFPLHKNILLPFPRDLYMAHYGCRLPQVVLVVKNPPANAGHIRDLGLIPGSRRSPGGRRDSPLQYSCLENPMDRRAWWTAVHGSQRNGHGGNKSAYVIAPPSMPTVQRQHQEQTSGYTYLKGSFNKHYPFATG